MKFISSTWILACAMLINMASAVPATQEISTTNTLQSRDSNGPTVGQRFSNVQGTYWNGSKWVGNCLFQDWPQPSGLPFVALAGNLYGSGAYCGACVKVTPVNKRYPPKIAIINDQCPDCPANALDMSPALYNAVMGNAPGRTGVSRFDWEVVPCPLPTGSKMKLISKDGASQYHFSLQIAGTINPVVKVEVQVGSSWQTATRKKYNYWELSQGSAGPQPDVRVTCSRGAPVLVPKVKISSSSVVTADGNC